MAKAYRYARLTTERIAYYSGFERPGSAPPPGEQPPLVRDLFPVHAQDPLSLAPGEPDIRGFAVNTPNGDTIGHIEALLADAVPLTLPYAYVRTTDGRLVVVPTDQLTFFTQQAITVLEWGKPALLNAPEAKFEAADSDRADHYWAEIRRQHAA